MKIQYPIPSDQLEAAVGYTFKDKNKLKLALTHSSYSNEMRAKDIKCQCNERLEFLGDSVLSFVTSEYLYLQFGQMPEGVLSRIRAGTVCEKTLCRLAQGMCLGDYLLLGHGEEITNGRSRPSLLADAFEALLAAIFLDGGIEAAKAFVLPQITSEIDLIVESGSDRDYKTSLQQIIQQEKGELLEYVTVSESGPAHKRIFEVEAQLNGNIIGRGIGSSKRAAEQCAAKEALALFGI